MAENHTTRTAPFYSVPSRRIVSIEHPAIIKNVDKAIDTLQGKAGIIKALDPPKADTPANLVLRPEDAMSRPMQSLSSASNNILLQVTVPKRTGRKRKRGSNDPFTDDPASEAHDGPPRPTARQFMRSLRDNVGKYQVEPVGLVERTHVFRGMPDFVFSTTKSPFVNRFREKILPFDFEKMKEFDLDMSKGATSNVDLIPPPSFSHGDIPFNYFYRQNPTVRQTLDTSGNITTVNTQQAAKVLTHLVPFDVATVPSSPRPNCPPNRIPGTRPPRNNLHRPLPLRVPPGLVPPRPPQLPQHNRTALRPPPCSPLRRVHLPLWPLARRHHPLRPRSPLRPILPNLPNNNVPHPPRNLRNSPRQQREQRHLRRRRHTLLPRPNDLTNPEAATSETSHLFTGQPPLPLDGRMWMFCDITDPLLQSILSPSPEPANFLRKTCDTTVDGWYGNGTTAKLKAIMRHKILALYEGRTTDDSEYAALLDLPDHASPATGLAGFGLDPGRATATAMMLGTEIRSTIKGALTWKEMVRGKQGRGDGGGGNEEQGGVNVEDEGEGEGVEEEESEGEEEAIEQEEMMEAAAEAVESAAKRKEEEGNDNDDDDVDDEMEG